MGLSPRVFHFLVRRAPVRGDRASRQIAQELYDGPDGHSQSMRFERHASQTVLYP